MLTGCGSYLTEGKSDIKEDTKVLSLSKTESPLSEMEEAMGKQVHLKMFKSDIQKHTVFGYHGWGPGCQSHVSRPN